MRAADASVLCLLALFVGAAGCQHGRYDKDLRLYLDSGEPHAAGAMESGGWYVVGARMPDAQFFELGIRFPANQGERLELRREGDAVFASAAGIEVPVKDVPPDAIYIAWARQHHRPDVDRPEGYSRRRGFDPIGAVVGGFFNAAVDGIFDDDDDDDDPKPRKKRSRSKQEDRGERYERSEPEDKARQRTRDD